MRIMSRKMEAYMKKGVTLGQKIHAHPFNWNNAEQLPALVTTRRAWRTWYLNIAITIFYSLFLLLRTIQVTIWNEEAFGLYKRIYMQFVLLWNCFGALLQLNLWLKKDQVRGFYFKIFTMWTSVADTLGQQNIGNALERQRSITLKMADMFLDYFWCVQLMWVAVVAAITMANPESPELLSSVLLPKESIFRLPIFGCCILFQAYFQFLIGSNACLWTFLGFGFAFPGVALLRDIRRSLQPEHLDQVHPTSIIKTYQQLLIPTGYFHDLYCGVLIPATKVIFMSAVVCCTYIGIRMTAVVLPFSLGLGLLSIISLVAIFGVFAAFHTLSSQVLRLVRQPEFFMKLNPYQKKVVASLPLVQIRMGGTYIVDNPNVITILRIVFETTINFLITYP